MLILELNECYIKEGKNLVETICLNTITNDQRLHGELISAPRAFMKSDQVQILGNRFETTFASGWTVKSDFGSSERGFLLSDHADWNDLLKTIKETKAKKVYVQHRGKGTLVRYLKGLEVLAFPDTELYPENPDQLALF